MQSVHGRHRAEALGGAGVFRWAHALSVGPVGPFCLSPGPPWPTSGRRVQAQLGIQVAGPQGRKEGEGLAQRGPGIDPSTSHHIQPSHPGALSL